LFRSTLYASPIMERSNRIVQQHAYGPMAKTFHWLTMALLIVQYAIGWIMPGVKRGMTPDSLMNLHISIGAVILALVLARFLWRLFHHVPPEPGLTRWQNLGATFLHLALYALIIVTTLTGWFYASMRGWTLSIFGVVPLPALVAEGSRFGRVVGELHQVLIWVLLVAILLHVAAALAHLVVYRDRVMQRMLPGLAD
jgi:cytochrome b561